MATNIRTKGPRGAVEPPTVALAGHMTLVTSIQRATCQKECTTVTVSSVSFRQDAFSPCAQLALLSGAGLPPISTPWRCSCHRDSHFLPSQPTGTRGSLPQSCREKALHASLQSLIGHMPTPEPITVARGTACADWLSHSSACHRSSCFTRHREREGLSSHGCSTNIIT